MVPIFVLMMVNFDSVGMMGPANSRSSRYELSAVILILTFNYTLH